MRQNGALKGLKRKGTVSLIWLISLFCIAVRPAFGDIVSKEYQIKAAFLYKFLNFVEWEAPQRGKVICVYGTNPFGDSLTQLIKEHDGSYDSTQFRHVTRPQDFHTCSILFISNSEKEERSQILAAAKTLPVMTVSDINQFAQEGGVIEFILQESRIRFVINQAQAKRSGIKISSHLLALAKNVIVEE